MRWLWIDRVVALEPGRRLLAVKCVSLSEPHLHQHLPADDNRPARPLAPAPLLIEGMAQAAGLLVGHARDFADAVVLAKVARAEFAFDVPPGWTIHFDARLNAIDASGASTSGLLRAGDAADAQPHELGRVDLMFAHVPAADHEILEARAFRTLAAASVAAGLEDAGLAALASGA